MYLESVVISMLSYEVLKHLTEIAQRAAWPTDSKLPLEVNEDFLDLLGSLGGLERKASPVKGRRNSPWLSTEVE